MNIVDELFELVMYELMLVGFRCSYHNHIQTKFIFIYYSKGGWDEYVARIYHTVNSSYLIYDDVSLCYMTIDLDYFDVGELISMLDRFKCKCFL